MSDLGVKADKGKPRASLLPLGILYQVIAVLEFGARRYAVDNWQHVPDARRRYYDAALRHIEAWWTGEQNDPESGQHHLAHATACLMFLQWFDGRERAKKPPCFGGHSAPTPEDRCEKCPFQVECVKEYTSG